MPIIDGLIASGHFREYESTNRLSRRRIIALTCFGTEESRRDAALRGVDLFLTKSINMKFLKPVVGLDAAFVADEGMTECMQAVRRDGKRGAMGDGEGLWGEGINR